jgi:hypothetical protein
MTGDSLGKGARSRTLAFATAMIVGTATTILAWVPWMVGPPGVGGGIPGYTDLVHRNSAAFLLPGPVLGAIAFTAVLLYIRRCSSYWISDEGSRGFIITALWFLILIPGTLMVGMAVVAQDWGEGGASAAFLTLLGIDVITFVCAAGAIVRRRHLQDHPPERTVASGDDIQ